MVSLDPTTHPTPADEQVAASPATSPGAKKRLSRWDRPPPPKDWRWFVGKAGRVLIVLGLFVFGFVAYQLWGTGLETARAQRALEGDFEELLLEAQAVPPATEAAVPPANDPEPEPATAPPVTDPPESGAENTPPDPGESLVVPASDQLIPVVEDGDALARIEIPRIGADHIVVAGVSWSDLKKGPGHYPDTPLPGQLGNAAIAGHRTTYGQPFHDVDQLEAGDKIIVTTASGRFVYRVTDQQIVSPSDYEVVSTTDPTVANLTLTSCHPVWSNSQRIIISSELDTGSSGQVGEPVLNYGRDFTSTPAAEPADDNPFLVIDNPTLTTESSSGQPLADAFGDGWFSDPGAPPHVAFWGLLLLAIGIGGYLISRRFRRDWVGVAVALLPFVVALYFFYQNVNRFLPPNL